MIDIALVHDFSNDFWRDLNRNGQLRYHHEKADQTLFRFCRAAFCSILEQSHRCVVLEPE